MCLKAMTKCDKNKKMLDAQQEHWEEAYSEESFFGEEPSYPARKAAEIFRFEKKYHILELGAGQGRDTLFFAANGFKVTALDYSKNAVGSILEKAEKLGLSSSVVAVHHDVRNPFPFEGGSFDACYCHMLYCMALCNSELEALFSEVHRVLKPNGINIYTVRNTEDPHFGKGIHRGEDIYEFGGFIVHFFGKEKIESLAKSFDIIDVGQFEEGELPRKLFLVKLRKKG
jgi:SAM-dependent methyltransferase